MNFSIFAIFAFVFLIQSISIAHAQEDSPQNINKFLNNQAIVSR